MDPEAKYLTQQMDPVKGGRSNRLMKKGATSMNAAPFFIVTSLVTFDHGKYYPAANSSRHR